MNSSEQLSSKLMDIQLPSAPIASEGFGLMVIFACLFIAVMVLVGFYQYYTRGAHRRRLNRIEGDFKQDKITSRELAYQVAHTLCDGLALHTLSSQNALPAGLRHRQDEWHTFTIKLNTYRYAKEQPDRHNITVLVTESCDWLRHWH